MKNLNLTRNRVEQEIRFGKFTDPYKEKETREQFLNDWISLYDENELLKIKLDFLEKENLETKKYADRIADGLKNQIEYSTRLTRIIENLRAEVIKLECEINHLSNT